MNIASTVQIIPRKEEKQKHYNIWPAHVYFDTIDIKEEPLFLYDTQISHDDEKSSKQI